MTRTVAVEFLRRHVYPILIALFVLAILVFSFVPIHNALRAHTKDYGNWYRTGQVVLQGGDIYRHAAGDTFDFMYPPFAAILLAPLSALGQVPLVVVLDIVNALAWVASVLLAVYLVTGKALRQDPLLYLVPAACAAPFVWNIYLLGQPNLLLLALMLGAFACLRQRRQWAAGALIALATAIKAFPILSVVYLVWRRQWKAAGFTMVFLFCFLVLLPAPFRGFHRNLQDLKTWNDGMALHYSADSIAQRPGRGYSWRNQSLLAVGNRLLRPVQADDRTGHSLYVNFADLEFKSVNVVIAIVSLALCLWYVTSMPAFAQRTGETDSLEYAMLLLLILVFTPLSFGYGFVWLLYPLVAALHLVLTVPTSSRGRWVAVGWFLVCLILLALNLPFFVRAQASGCSFWLCVLLLAGLGWHLRHRKIAVQPGV